MLFLGLFIILDAVKTFLVPNTNDCKDENGFISSLSLPFLLVCPIYYLILSLQLSG